MPLTSTVLAVASSAPTAWGLGVMPQIYSGFALRRLEIPISSWEPSPPSTGLPPPERWSAVSTSTRTELAGCFFNRSCCFGGPRPRTAASCPSSIHLVFAHHTRFHPSPQILLFPSPPFRSYDPQLLRQVRHTTSRFTGKRGNEWEHRLVNNTSCAPTKPSRRKLTASRRDG